jgi:hypothetical protein
MGDEHGMVLIDAPGTRRRALGVRAALAPEHGGPGRATGHAAQEVIDGAGLLRHAAATPALVAVGTHLHAKLAELIRLTLDVAGAMEQSAADYEAMDRRNYEELDRRTGDLMGNVP